MEGSGRSKKFVATFHCIHTTYQWRGFYYPFICLSSNCGTQDASGRVQQTKRSRVAVKVLLSELTRRFRKITDPSDECHNPLFLMAMALDPRYRLLLNPVQVESAKSTITQEIHNLTTSDELESTSSSGKGSPSHTISTIAEPPAKHFRHLDKVLQMNWKEQVKKKSKLPPGKVEVDFESTDSLADNTDPIEYWLNQQVTYPLLIKLCCNRYPV